MDIIIHYEVLDIASRKVENCDRDRDFCPLLDLNTDLSEPIEQLIKRKTQGVLKDTVILPPGGAVVLRIQSDNPGVWFLHCHIHDHLLSGLALALNEGNYRYSQTKFPKDYPSCDYSGNLQFLRTATCDCNKDGEEFMKSFTETAKPTNETNGKRALKMKCSTASECNVPGN